MLMIVKGVEFFLMLLYKRRPILLPTLPCLNVPVYTSPEEYVNTPCAREKKEVRD